MNKFLVDTNITGTELYDYHAKATTPAMSQASSTEAPLIMRR